MTEPLERVSAVVADAVVEDPAAGVYRANRRIFTDEELFELELKHIFEGNWLYLAHESQVPEPGDQSPDGLEVLRGASTYTYNGNWKVQAENGADGYHVTATHWNYAATTARRTTGESQNDTKTLDAGSWGKSGCGYWSFPHGHLCLWTWAGNLQDRPLWNRMAELKE